MAPHYIQMPAVAVTYISFNHHSMFLPSVCWKLWQASCPELALYVECSFTSAGLSWTVATPNLMSCQTVPTCISYCKFYQQPLPALMFLLSFSTICFTLSGALAGYPKEANLVTSVSYQVCDSTNQHRTWAWASFKKSIWHQWELCRCARTILWITMHMCISADQKSHRDSLTLSVKKCPFYW